MRKYVAIIFVLFVSAIFLSGCLSGEGQMADEINGAAEESDYDRQLREYLEDHSGGVNYTPSNLSSDGAEIFGLYQGYDFTDEEIIGMWENIEKSSDDMVFNSDHTYRYQLDTSNLGNGWRQYQWYEGTWKINNGSAIISLNGSDGYFQDTWTFTKNADGTMNCIDGKIFEKAKSITVASS